MLKTLELWLNSRWIILFAAGIVLAALLAYYPDVTDDFDVWWHLKYGEHFVRNLTWTIDHSAFSWTPSDPAWVYVSWIGSSLLYLVHLIGGYPALVVLQWLIFFCVAGLFYVFVRLSGSKWTVAHLAGLLLAGVAINPIALYLKPELFTLLFFAGAVIVYFASKVNQKNYFWIYPALFLVWVNAHGGFINGLAFITLALIAEALVFVLKRPYRMPKSLLWHLTAGVGLSYAAAMANPYGVLYLANIFQNTAAGGSHVRSVTAYSPLWNYLFPAEFFFRRINSAWGMVLMAVVLFGLVCALWTQKKKIDLPVLVLNVIFFLFGFSIFRASIYFCILWLFSCQYLLRLGQWRPDWRSEVPALIVSLSVSVMIIYEMLVYNIYDSRLGSRIENFVPAVEAEFVSQNKLPGPLFNDYLSGGYLIRALPPEYRVFIDPRYGPYVSTGVWNDYLALLASPDLQMLDDKYRCNTALIMNGNQRLVGRFLKSPEWGLAYFDAAAVVFLRRNSLKAGGENRLMGDMRAEKFRNISNPLILTTVFYLYCNYHPPSASRILAYYEANVRRAYKFRSFDIGRMQTALTQRGVQNTGAGL